MRPELKGCRSAQVISLKACRESTDGFSSQMHEIIQAVSVSLGCFIFFLMLLNAPFHICTSEGTAVMVVLVFYRVLNGLHGWLEMLIETQMENV